MSARAKAALVSVLIMAAVAGIWFGALAILGTPGQGDCPGVNPPAAVPGPPVVADR
ncbi:hypothetical protein [Kribbella sp. NBC_00889]|uniref:hypothetical protein n=1 Tax=Kribbella sp. NBC_00889 TaxID=2975974 RepID=UPI0038709F3D|nr:hypothetical protein OG817_22070 [Kribbella sp. NBC_00889]